MLDKTKTTGYIKSMPKPSVRNQILAAGLETLHKRGFNATGVQDITDAAAVPKGSFYNHFASKEAFGAEIVLQYVERNDVFLRILRDTSVEPLPRLRRYFQALNDAVAASDFERGCLLGNFGTELSSQSQLIRERVASAFTAWTSAIATVLAEAQHAGTLTADVDTQTLAEFLINAWEGAVMRAKVEQSQQPMDLFLNVTFSRILA